MKGEINCMEFPGQKHKKGKKSDGHKPQDEATKKGDKKTKSKFKNFEGDPIE